MKISIVIRTYNEERYLGSVLEKIKAQQMGDFSKEVIIVDSGSQDRTKDIAESYGCRILHISKEEFTFGRSLNIGCAAATGEFLVFVSGHCVPATNTWMLNLIKPLHDNLCAYSYGRQMGNENSRFSECQLFNKYYPDVSQTNQQGFFCNNANAALKFDVWEVNHFNEELTGLEDMELAKRLVGRGHNIGYVADASIYHIHDETWRQVHRRYKREAIALQGIMPEVQVSFNDFLRYFASAALFDMATAIDKRELLKKSPEIFMFRLMQFWGAYQGNHEVRKMSHKRKEKYFFPK